MKSKPFVSRVVLCGSMAACAAALPSAVQAHETDQYTLPMGREFADLRMYFARDIHGRLAEAVASLNRKIDGTLADGQPTPATERYYSPENVASAALFAFPPVILFIETYDSRLRDRALQEEYPGLVVAHMPSDWIYHHWALVLNPTKVTRLKRCSTVMVDGVYFGTDKLAHFVHMGYIYFSSYRRAVANGAAEQEAVARAIQNATGANLFLSENALLGMFTTGVRSNGDLASNYCGFKFFRNLTEPVMLKGQMRPPMLVREGPYWRLNDHVRPNSDFFAYFISDHWNEAFNPNTYGLGVGTCVQAEIARRCDRLLDWYRDDHGRQRTQEDFRRLAAELRTYYGADYGHSGGTEDLVQIANTCFDENGNPKWMEPMDAPGADSGIVASVNSFDASAAAEPVRPAPKPLHTAALFGNRAATQAVTFDASGPAPKRPARVALAAARPAPRVTSPPAGRPALLSAACNGDIEAVRRLCADHSAVNATDADGETALHCAARWGHVEIAKVLLDRGADVHAATRYGVTPLHLAVREFRPEVVNLLLSRGGDANTQDGFGCTPLHDAAAKGYTRIVELLLKSGADANVADVVGTTPLHRAARSGHADAAGMLVRAGSLLAARNRLGKTPADEAAGSSDQRLAEVLRPDEDRPVRNTAFSTGSGKAGADLHR